MRSIRKKVTIAQMIVLRFSYTHITYAFGVLYALLYKSIVIHIPQTYVKVETLGFLLLIEYLFQLPVD